MAQARQESTEEVARSAQGALQEQPGTPQELPEEAQETPKSGPERPKVRLRGFGSHSKSECAIFWNLRSRVHGSVIFEGRGALKSDQNRLSRASRGLCRATSSEKSHSRGLVE